MAATAPVPAASPSPTPSFDLACAVGALTEAQQTPLPERHRVHFAPSGASTPARLGFSTPARRMRPPEDAEAITKFFRARSASINSPIFCNKVKDSRYAQCEPEIRLNAAGPESPALSPHFVPEIVAEGAFNGSKLDINRAIDLHWRAARVPLPYAIRIAYNPNDGPVPVRAYLKFITSTATHMFVLVESKKLDIRLSNNPNAADDDVGSVLVGAVPIPALDTDNRWDASPAMSPPPSLAPKELQFTSSADSRKKPSSRLPGAQSDPDDDEEQAEREEDDTAEEDFEITFWAAPCLELRRGSANLLITIVDSESRCYEKEVTISAKGIKPQIAIKAPGFDADAQRTHTKVVFDDDVDADEQIIQIYNETANGAPVLAGVYLEENAHNAFSLCDAEQDEAASELLPFTIPPTSSRAFTVSFKAPTGGKVPLCYYGFAVVRLAYFLSSMSSYDDEIPEFYDHVIFLEAPRADGTAIAASPNTPKSPWGTSHSEFGAQSDPASSESRAAFAPTPPHPLKPIKFHVPFSSPAPLQVQFSEVIDISEDSLQEHQALFDSSPSPGLIPELDDTTAGKPHALEPASLLCGDRPPAEGAHHDALGPTASAEEEDKPSEAEENERDGEEDDENDICREFNAAPAGDKWLEYDPLLPGAEFNLPGFGDHEPAVQDDPFSPEVSDGARHWAQGPYDGGAGGPVPDLGGPGVYYGGEPGTAFARDLSGSPGEKVRYNGAAGASSAPVAALAAAGASPAPQRTPAPAPAPAPAALYETCDEAWGKRRDSPTDVAAAAAAPPPVKLRMPRGVRTRGVRVRAGAGGASLSLQNASAVAVTVRLALRGAGAHGLAALAPRLVELGAGAKARVAVTRAGAGGGVATLHLAVTPAGARGGSAAVAYDVALAVEPARARKRRTLAVDRPTLSFHAPAGPGAGAALRVLNCTAGPVTLRAQVRDVQASPVPAAVGPGSVPFAFDAGCAAAQVAAGAVHVLRVRYAPDEPRGAARHYAGWLDVASHTAAGGAVLRESVPLFGYSGLSRVACAVSGGAVRVWNGGARAGYALLADCGASGVVVMPGEEVRVPYSAGWRGQVVSGDEIERSRLREAVRRGIVADEEMRGLAPFNETFAGEGAAKEAEDLYWKVVSDVSLHYAARLFRAGATQAVHSGHGEFEGVRHEVKDQWGASWTADGSVHLVNGSPGTTLRFHTVGAEPSSGTVPELGDAVLTPSSDVVEIVARGKTIELRR